MARARMHHALSGIGLALALLTGATPLLESLHGAAVRHVSCPEDGELIDAAPQAPHAHAQVSGDRAELFSERAPLHGDGEGQQHDHCAVVQQAQIRAREGSRVRIPARIADASTSTVPAVELLQLRSAVLYRLAPKASPPA